MEQSTQEGTDGKQPWRFLHAAYLQPLGWRSGRLIKNGGVILHEPRPEGGHYDLVQPWAEEAQTVALKEWHRSQWCRFARLDSGAEAMLAQASLASPPSVDVDPEGGLSLGDSDRPGSDVDVLPWASLGRVARILVDELAVKLPGAIVVRTVEAVFEGNDSLSMDLPRFLASLPPVQSRFDKELSGPSVLASATVCGCWQQQNPSMTCTSKCSYERPTAALCNSVKRFASAYGEPGQNVLFSEHLSVLVERFWLGKFADRCIQEDGQDGDCLYVTNRELASICFDLAVIRNVFGWLNTPSADSRRPRWPVGIGSLWAVWCEAGFAELEARLPGDEESLAK
jgi:hypothetical protein